MARALRRVLGLLERLQPARCEGDVLWHGPFFIPRRGEWWPTRFLRYQEELYCMSDDEDARTLDANVRRAFPEMERTYRP